jgi:beta-lactamase regulating signal transducer with metallopeptidase domain/uncharacterized protein involved in exopolysaccharide biosynthesis
MNAFGELLNHPLTYRVGWTLLHSVWQGAIAAALFAVLRMMMRRRSANARYITGCLVLLFLALTAIATFFTVPLPSSGSTQPGMERVQSSYLHLLTQVSPAFPRLAFGGNAPASMQRLLENIERSIPLLVACWSIGVFIFSWRLLQGCRQLKRLRRVQTEPLDSVWMETLDDLRCRLNISRPVQILKSGLVEVPTVIGWLRPLILLPAGSLLGLTPGQLEAILAHELAHVARNDYLVNAFQLIVETVMFYHPAVWWISRCIREEREHCCDDLVIRAGSDRIEYASALATLEELRAISSPLAFAASGGVLVKRIRRLIGGPGNDGPMRAREVGGLALLGIGLGLVVVGICLLVSPPTYEAVARVRIERDQSAVADSGTAERPTGGNYDPYFMQTEFEVIDSDMLLGRVAKDLGLAQQWGERFGVRTPLTTTETITRLRSKLQLRPVRSTSLIQIKVVGEKTYESAAIANSIAQEYGKYRQEQRLQMSRGGIRALEERFKKQEEEVREAHNKVEDLREKLQIPDAATNVDGSLLLSAKNLRTFEAQRIELKTDLARQETMLKALNNLTHDQLVQVVPTAVPDALLGRLLDDLGLNEQKLVDLRKDYGEGHVEVQKANSRIADLNDKINRRLNGIMSALEVRVGTLKSSLEALEAEVESATTNDIKKARQTRPYYDAKRNLQQLQRFNQILTMKIAAEKMDAELPQGPWVEIIDRAVPSGQTISPNRSRGISLSGLGLLLTFIGLSMLRSAARVERSTQQ